MTTAVGATAQPKTRTGCTLSEYAAAKQLPEHFLRGVHITQVTYCGSPAVRIPYLDEQANEFAVHFRVALDGDGKFRFRKGSKPGLYGSWRLKDARAADAIVVVEGPSDVHTLWYYGIPAVGLPGAATWKTDWATAFEGIGTIYVVLEPDKGGQAVAHWLATASFRDRVRIIELDTTAKDPSALHLADPRTFQDRWAALSQAAILWSEFQARRASTAANEHWQKCEPLATAPRILGRFEEALLARGVVGETRAAQVLFLGLVSRLLDRIISIALKATSSSGKSFLVGQVLTFFPREAYYLLTGMSERALAYLSEPLTHRMLILVEAAGMGQFANYIVRSLLSEGHIRYVTVEKTSGGLRERVIEREGPTGLIVTTTAVTLHPENETRYLSVPLNDTRDQTRQIMLAAACEAAADDGDLEIWHHLQHWLALAGERRVTIPFSRELALQIPPASTRLRRDFPMLLAFIRAHAFLHQHQRQRDATGRVVAMLDDYAVVRALVSDLMAEAVESAVSRRIRDTVAAVKQLGPLPVSVNALARALDVDRSTAWRRACRFSKRRDPFLTTFSKPFPPLG